MAENTHAHASIGQRIAAIRRQQFVGREPEHDLLRSALLAYELPFSLLYLHGPGGVGKTTLLQSFKALCGALNIPSFLLDARNIEASPEAFLDALRTALDISRSEDPIAGLGAVAPRCVLFLDTFEVLGGMASWLRDVLLPQVSVNVLIVAAGRQPPSVAWPLDSGWQMVLRSIRMQNFTAQESAAYLSKRSVAAAEQIPAYRITHGHPLALSLLADLYAQAPQVENVAVFSSEAAPPEVIQTLLKRFMEEMPIGIRKSALEVCALVRGTTEALLREMLFAYPQKDPSLASPAEGEDAPALFQWLRELSFIDSGPSGLFPHDIAREAIRADLRWSNPDWCVELHRRARLYYTRQLQQNGSAEQQKRLLYDCIFLHCDNDIVRSAFTWDDMPAIATDSLQPGDDAAIAVMVAGHEGEESARIAAHWLAIQPEATLIMRDNRKGREPIAFFTMLTLNETSEADRAPDPATRAIWDFIERQGPLRPGERATYLRFWMAQDTHQKTSPLLSLLIVHALHHFLTRGQRLAYTFFCCHDPETWKSLFHYAGISRIDAEFMLDGHHYGVFGHDWRSSPLSEWIARMAEKEINAGSVYKALLKAEGSAEAGGLQSSSSSVLDAKQFATAVREALRDLNSPIALERNPLRRSRLFASHRAASGSGTAEPAAALRIAVLEAAESLNGPNPRRQRSYRALLHAYLTPAPTQEEAAHRLDLPFSTYRRHLAEGIAAVTEILWHKEIGEKRA